MSNTTDWNKVLEEILLENVWSSGDKEQDHQPCFGKYPADLILSADQDGSYRDTQTALDYPGSGPGPDGEWQLAPVWGYLCLFILLGGVVVTVWAFMSLVWPWISACYINLRGC